MMKQPSKKALEHIVALWNSKYPVGTKVQVRKLVGDVDFVETVTTSEAYVLGGHSPVIMLKGISGCFALTHCSPIT
jgi:hypothetical protein